MVASNNQKTINQNVGRFQDEMWTVTNESTTYITNHDITALRSG